MKRQSPYGDANMLNPYSPNQMQHVSLHRMQENSGINNYSGQMSSFMHEDDRSYASSAKADAHWQWERDAQQMSPHLHREGQTKGSNASVSYYQNKMSDPKLVLNQESRGHLQEQDMDVVREDNSSSQTFEGLEKKFTDDIMKLTKKHMDAEDAENARHRQKILEINDQYQEKVVALRARFAARREELLQKESQARLQQYQLASARHYQNDVGGPADMGPRGPFTGENQAQRGRGQFNSHRERRPMQGTESRGPPSSGRGYNTGSRYYY